MTSGDVHTTRPLVSIIIPAFNAVDFISRTLQSALGQDYESFEVIVVDDGSTDETPAIIAQFEGDPRLRVIRTLNQGVAAARNCGIFAARGTFVAFLDADDLWRADKVRKQMDFLHENPHYAAVYTWSVVIDTSDLVISPMKRWILDGFVFSQHLMTWPIGSGSNILVRRDLALSIGGFDSTYRDLSCGGAEDLDFELRIAERYLFGCVPDVLVGYRSSPGNMSSDSARMRRATNLVMGRAVERNRQLPPLLRRWARGRVHYYAAFTLGSGQLPRCIAHVIKWVWYDPTLAIQTLAHHAGRVLLRALRERRDADPSLPFYSWVDCGGGFPSRFLLRRAARLKQLDDILVKQFMLTTTIKWSGRSISSN